MKSGNIFYFAPVSPDNAGDVNKSYKENSAVRNKVLGVCKALQIVGQSPVVVSTFSAVASQGRKHHAVADGVPVIAIGAKGSGAARRISSAWGYFLASLKLKKRGLVVYYNFFPEYILSALVFRLSNTPCLIDIEDSPPPGERGAKGIVNKVSFTIMKALCLKKYLVVSHSQALALRLTDYLPVYGVADQYLRNSKKSPPFLNNEVKIIMGGSIFHETGSTLLIDAMRLLKARKSGPIIHFIITGSFQSGLFDEVSRELDKDVKTKVTIYRGLSYDSYRKILLSCDIGLCLKLSAGVLSNTTFPSKVVEISASGLLLCSTSVSDVPAIFGNSNAILLKSDDAEELASALIDAATNIGGSRLKAALGRELMEAKFAEEAVGRDIVRFFNNGL